MESVAKQDSSDPSVVNGSHTQNCLPSYNQWSTMDLSAQMILSLTQNVRPLTLCLHNLQFTLFSFTVICGEREISPFNSEQRKNGKKNVNLCSVSGHTNENCNFCLHSGIK